ncbi:MAG TPA: hypothetical protein VFO34_15525 [Candidatus Acidoferrales bacterium]|nr:hypothetical protein [Candidatus Acidoferrales bacterium]
MNIFATRPFSRVVLRFTSFAALISVLVPFVVAQAGQSVTLTKIYVDEKSGRIHIVDSSMKDLEIPPEKDQVDTAQPKIADDHRTAGWLIESKIDDGTSYPIPLCLIIYRDAKIIRRFPTDMTIGDWRFVDGAKQVALYTDTLHGSLAPHYELRDVSTGRLIAKFDGHLGPGSPAWTRGFSEN